MILSKWRRNIKGTKHVFLTKSVFVLVYAVTALALITLSISKGVRDSCNMKLTFSIADGLCKLTTFEYFLPCILILHAVYFNISIVDDLSLVEIVRHDSRGGVWIRESRKIFVLSLCFSIYAFLSAIVISLFFTNSAINFDETNSLFYYYTEAYSGPSAGNPYGVSFVQVVIFAFVSLFFAFYLISMIVFLMKWLTNNVFIGWIIVMLIIAVDLGGGVPVLGGEYSLLLGNISNGYPYFLNIRNMIIRLVIPFVWLIVMNISGLIAAERKDFID